MLRLIIDIHDNQEQYNISYYDFTLDQLKLVMSKHTKVHISFHYMKKNSFIDNSQSCRTAESANKYCSPYLINCITKYLAIVRQNSGLHQEFTYGGLVSPDHQFNTAPHFTTRHIGTCWCNFMKITWNKT